MDLIDVKHANGRFSLVKENISSVVASGSYNILVTMNSGEVFNIDTPYPSFIDMLKESNKNEM